MATKSAKKAQTNRAKEVKVPMAIGINKLNKKAIKVTDQLVDETLATGEEWQAIFAKAVKNGTVLLDKQTDIVFDTLEDVKAQILKGNKRFRKLFAIDYAEAKLAKYGKEASKKMAATATDAKTRVEQLADKLEDIAEDTLDNAKAMMDVIPTVEVETKKVAKKTAKKVVAKSKAKKTAAKASTKKVTAKKAVKAAPKAVAKKAKKVVAKTIATKSNLTVIEGIGPKIESLLNAAGILTFDRLAKSNAADVKEILLAAGSRYKMHNPATWMEQATLAAAGKTAELKALQATLKGGKK